MQSNDTTCRFISFCGTVSSIIIKKLDGEKHGFDSESNSLNKERVENEMHVFTENNKKIKQNAT
jgi:hypothetical protein